MSQAWWVMVGTLTCCARVSLWKMSSDAMKKSISRPLTALLEVESCWVELSRVMGEKCSVLLVRKVSCTELGVSFQSAAMRMGNWPSQFGWMEWM